MVLIDHAASEDPRNHLRLKILGILGRIVGGCSVLG